MEESKGTASGSVDSYGVVDEASRGSQLSQQLTSLSEVRQEYSALKARLPGVELPQLPYLAVVLIGNQSAGKSSVAEALTGLKLATDAVICTRRVIIVDSYPSFNGETYFTINNKHEEKLTEEEVVSRIAAANARPEGATNAFIKEPLFVSTYRPGAPRFQVVDTPGLIMSNETITAEDEAMLPELILTYIAPKSSCIVEVVDWHNASSACNLAHELAVKADPDRTRTTTLYTKCDFDIGGEAARADLRARMAEGSAYFVAVKDVEADVILSNEEEVERLRGILGCVGPTVGQDAFERFLGAQLVRLMEENMPDVITAWRV